MRLRILAVGALWAGAALAQTDPGTFSVEPLPDLPAPGAEGQGGGFGFAINPDMGLQGTGVPNPDRGIVVAPDAASGQDGVFVQVNPGGQDGVALVQAPNRRAEERVTSVAATTGPGATLRALDKTIGQTTDIEMVAGEAVVFGRIAIRLVECRYPTDNPASDAFAHIQVADLAGSLLFDGWMIASSPALMALEHPRYDVWVLSCNTS